MLIDYMGYSYKYTQKSFLVIFFQKFLNAFFGVLIPISKMNIPKMVGGYQEGRGYLNISGGGGGITC
jgi:hypothetical protein